MKIVIDDAIPFIKDRLPKHVETVYIPGSEITADKIKNVDALIVRTRTRCDSSLLEGSDVRLVATATIGTDHIDMDWCEKNGISVRSAPGCNAPGVAQYVFSSLFKSGFDLKNDILGVVGHGNVGSTVVSWARKMGIKILVNDPPRKERGERDQEYKELSELLHTCDAVTLHVPFTKSGHYPTYHLIGEKEIGMMKPGTILINSSRGGVVEEKALKSALKDKRIKAVTDVWQNEPHIDRELSQLCLISTPHIAGYSEEGKKRATRMVLEALRDVLHISTDLSGLECVPEDGRIITKELILSSYDPQKDHDELTGNPLRFEALRNNYQYRHEPLFY